MTRLRVRLILALASAQAFLVDRLAVLLSGRPRAGRDVLVVRLDAIGDFLLWSDAAGRLADHYRAGGRRVFLLGNALWAGLAETMGVFDGVIHLDRRRFLLDPRYRFATQRWIRKAGFAIAIQPTFSRELLMGDAIVRIAGREERIGSEGDLANIDRDDKRRSDQWYSRLIPASPGPMMELLRNAEFLAGLGIACPPRIGRLPVAAEIRSAGRADGDGGAPYFVLFPGASREARCWSPVSFARLAERISTATGWQAVIAGGGADRPAAAAIKAATDLPLTDRVGATDLLGLARLLAGARVVISNETSATHLSAVVGTPAVSIVGGGHFGRFLPYDVDDADRPRAPIAVHHPMDCYGCNWQCRHPRGPGEAYACIRAVSVDQVWEALLPLLPGGQGGSAKQ